MKQLILSFALAFCLFTSAGLFAQNNTVNNATTDTWLITVYGAATIVPPQTFGIPVNIGTNCDDGIRVSLYYDDSCYQTFTASGYWQPSCASRTSFVFFSAHNIVGTTCPLSLMNFGFTP